MPCVRVLKSWRLPPRSKSVAEGFSSRRDAQTAPRLLAFYGRDIGAGLFLEVPL